MQLSRDFVGLMGFIILFLVVAFATEDARCVARARRAFERYLSPVPVSIASDSAPTADGSPVGFASLSMPPTSPGNSCLR